jgi:hypothetical protein
MRSDVRAAWTLIQQPLTDDETGLDTNLTLLRTSGRSPQPRKHDLSAARAPTRGIQLYDEATAHGTVTA